MKTTKPQLKKTSFWEVLSFQFKKFIFLLEYFHL